MSNPGIVVIAYNREDSLRRLLKSLGNANYPSNQITLHISIDASDNPNVKPIADDFEWKYGEKIVDLKSENQGLLKHILECGSLSEKYESIIVLEDDLVVAPDFYNYAVQANDFYSSDEKIAGVSLYAYSSEENNFLPFEPILDNSGVHFIQVASSWGQSWNKDQWSNFTSWLTENPNGKESLLPDYILKWGSNSWKKLFINYLIDQDRYFVFPNTSYSTNFEEEGTHASDTGLFQVQLNLGNYIPTFGAFSDSKSIYDEYFELQSNCIKKHCKFLAEFDFQVDIFGTKPVDSSQSELILTTRRGKNPIYSFGARMKPLIQNVLFEIEGPEIGLYHKKDLLLTENNRFLALNTAPVSLDQQTEVRKQLIEPLLTILPVPNILVESIEITFDIAKPDNDKFYDFTVLIVCSESSKEKISKIVESAPLKVEFVISDSQDINELLRLGIESCSTDYCSWIQAGMKIDLDSIEKVTRIFQGMSQVQVLHGVHEECDESNYLKLTTASSRWTPQIANLNKDEVGSVRTELVFWRKSLLNGFDLEKMNASNLFLELLKLNPVYVAAIKIGDMNGREAVNCLTKDEVAKSIEDSQFQPKKGIRVITRPIFRLFFRRNVLFFRLFYRETERLPMVIRYDFKNDSFYLDNY
ncbi:MAG: hypothetical protein ACI865_002979 [Flavobacteriaceae bacterium]|jgi:hypothetical protein